MKKQKIEDFKVVILGESGVGKTSLLERFIKNIFGRTPATCGLSYINYNMNIENTSIKLNIWDTAGQERYHCLTTLYYRNSHAAIVVYDIENRDSFHRAKIWVTALRNQNPPTNVIALAANKCEPFKCHTAVNLNEVMDYAKDNDLIFMETSAKTAMNVQELFVTVGKALVDDMINYGQDATKVGSIKCCAETCENDKSKSGKCC